MAFVVAVVSKSILEYLLVYGFTPKSAFGAGQQLLALSYSKNLKK